MDNREVLKPIAEGLKHNSLKPPRDVVWAVASLLNAEAPADVPALLRGWWVESDGSTTWHALALTETKIITVSATAGRAPWGLGIPRGVADVPADSLSASARPRASVSRLDVLAVESTWGENSSLLSEWVVSWRIHFDDGESFDLPADRYVENGEIPLTLLAELD